MSYTYAGRKESDVARKQTDAVKDSPQLDPHLSALQSGAEQPTSADMGHRIDLSDAMRAKMEAAFGADLSTVKLYQSQAVADSGAQAVSKGDSIAFAPGKADFSTQRGQELLGHELSHVIDNRRNSNSGEGYLYDPAHELKADREGAMAAAGEQVYTGPVTGTLSAAVPPLSMAGPMQASREEERAKSAAESMIPARKLQENLDASHAQASRSEVNQLYKYQQNLGDVKYFLENQNKEGFTPDKKFTRGQRIHTHLQSMKAKADADLNDPQLDDDAKRSAQENSDLLSGIETDVAGASPLSPEYEILRRSDSFFKRKSAYEKLSEKMSNNVRGDEPSSIRNYIYSADPFNSLLRNLSDDDPVPQDPISQFYLGQSIDISKALRRNRLEQSMKTYRGVNDIFLRRVLADNGINEALNDAGDVNHEWIGNNMDEFNRRLTGKLFRDRGFTSTTTSRSFAEYWAHSKGKSYMRDDLEERRDQGEITEDQYKKGKSKLSWFGKTAGAHVMDVELPKGAAANVVDYFNMGGGSQDEVLVNMDSIFQFMGVEPGKVKGSYNMKVRLLNEEERRRLRQEDNNQDQAPA